MNYKIDKTIFRHRLWGEGVLRSIDDTVLSIEFPQTGLKRLTFYRLFCRIYISTYYNKIFETFKTCPSTFQ